MAQRVTVIVSQSQSRNPAKAALEEQIVGGLLSEPRVDVVVVPNLYDLSPDGSGTLCLQGVTGEMIVCSWLYPRAARWILSRNGVSGRSGETLIAGLGEGEDEDEEAQDDEEQADVAEEKRRVVDGWALPDRAIYCLDLRADNSAQTYLDEIRRIVQSVTTETVDLTQWIGGSPRPEQMERFLDPAGSGSGNGHAAAPVIIEESPDRRWYPVIDFSRCTNCMECIDFCLFGVYGVDRAETILVDQPDNCRKGCPACSRVCPENAILFPQHKSPAIAGSAEVAGSLKIDLSQLFGAAETPAAGTDAIETAVRERDEQLLLAGRQAVGPSVGIPKRQADAPSAPKDELDVLIDQLDALDL